MQKTEYIQENVTFNFPKNFEIQTNHTIHFRKLDLVLINKLKKRLSSREFCCFTEKIKESEK